MVEMEPIAARYFDQEEDGTWHIYELEEEREKLLSAREKMSQGAKNSVIARAEKSRREQEEQRATKRAERERADANDLPAAFVEGLHPVEGQVRVGSGYPDQTLTENDADPAVPASGSRVAPHRLTDCSILPSEEKNSNSPSVYTPHQEGYHGQGAREPERANDVTGSREPTTLVVDAVTEARVQSPDPCPTLAARAQAEGSFPTDDEIAAAIETAGGARVDIAWRSLDCMKKLRGEFLEKRFELADFATAVAAVTTERHKVLRNPAADHVIQAARRACQLRTKSAATERGSATSRLYLADPNYEAIVEALLKPPAKIDPLKESSPPYREYRALPTADLEQASSFVHEMASSRAAQADQMSGQIGREAPP